MKVLFIVLAIFFLLIALRVPVGISMGIASMCGFTMVGFELTTVAGVVYSSVSSASMMCIPGYILAGALMSRGGIAKALVDVMEAWIGHLHGGMAIAAVVACGFFAAITGSSAATIAAIGTLMIPAMVDAGYEKEFSMGLIAGSGSLGILIPPSITMVLYAVAAEVSVAKLFSAGMLPGIIVVVLYSIYSIFYSKRVKRGIAPRKKIRERLQITVKAIPALLLPVIVLGGIYGGIMTATEASALACVYAILASVFIYHGFTLKTFIDCVIDSLKSTANIFIIMVGCAMFALLLSAERIPKILLEMVMSASMPPMLVVVMCTVVILILGCFLDGNSIVLITAPLMAPIISAIGYDLVAFGIVLTVGIQVGMMTPPVGLNLFMVASMENEPVGKVLKGNLPFLLIMVAFLFALIFIPDIATCIPKLIYS